VTKIGCVLCTGCPESRIDSARIQNFLKKNGWKITKNLKKADLILFRACGLTDKMAINSLSIIRKIKAEKRKDAQFFVWGCLSKIDPKALRTEYNAVTFHEDNIEVLDDILNPKTPVKEVTANYVMPGFEQKRSGLYGFLRKLLDFSERCHSVAQNEKFFHIKASTGCLGNCSFCAVRKSRGVVQSKNIEGIISEFRDGLNKGFRYFSLLATDLGAYGRDLGCNLVNLLTEMTKEKGDYKIGLRNFNPYYLNEMFNELKPIFSSGKIWFLSSAVESGSNRILKLMNRRYKVQDFKRCIQSLNKDYPDIFLRTQIIVGFPTETTEDYQKSVRLLNELKFGWVEVYKFSPRKGTAAATMAGQVPQKIKDSHFRSLTFRALVQHPHKKISKIIQSFSKSYC
jgi:threonylcarbamoyladenosine tRNA methylthiotransferase CDKAL1